MTEFSLILTGYNEGPTLADSLQRTLLAVSRLGVDFEILAIDDASSDDTAAVMQRFVDRNDVPGEFWAHDENRGRGAAVREGLARARGAVVGYLDVDLEVGPEYIPLFYDAIRDGAELAIGRRIYRTGLRSLPRHVASRAYAQLVRRRLHVPFADTEAGYKFFSADAARLIAAETRHPGWFWDTEVVVTALRRGLRIVEIPCLYVRRFDKASSVHLLRDSVEYLRALRRFERT